MAEVARTARNAVRRLGKFVTVTVVVPIFWLVLTVAVSYLQMMIAVPVEFPLYLWFLAVFYIGGVVLSNSRLLVWESGVHPQRWPYVTVASAAAAIIFLLVVKGVSAIRPFEELWFELIYIESVVGMTWVIDRLIRRWYH
jgi:hypothetical protein